jgi:hypothetical protein
MFAIVFSLLSKHVCGSAGRRVLLQVDSQEVASGSAFAMMMHVLMGWPCAEIMRIPARYRRRSRIRFGQFVLAIMAIALVPF